MVDLPSAFNISVIVKEMTMMQSGQLLLDRQVPRCGWMVAVEMDPAMREPGAPERPVATDRSADLGEQLVDHALGLGAIAATE
ncbi:hypothetical protein [Thiocapsa imhoffii]|uniref:hypothetical protein n=1 Tax=Thiocapsa imhoffii TaxID=382777 RepID=UPI00190755CC|nr:hypothetical protein [Thiocapsa imhoffii]